MPDHSTDDLQAELYGLIQESTGPLKSPKILLPAPIMSTYETRKEKEGEVC